MGQILHGSAKTTHAVRALIQRSKASNASLSRKLGINVKTVAKWRKRDHVADAQMGPKEVHSTVLSIEEEAVIVTFRRHTLPPLDDCLYALQPSIPHLTRSSLHRCLQRHGISRLPEVKGDKPKKKFKRYPVRCPAVHVHMHERGYFHIDIAEVRTGEGKIRLFVAIDRTSRFACVELHERAGKMVAAQFLRNLCQRRLNFSQKCRSKFPHLFGTGDQPVSVISGSISCLWRPSAALRRRRGSDRGVGADMLGALSH